MRGNEPEATAEDGGGPPIVGLDDVCVIFRNPWGPEDAPTPVDLLLVEERRVMKANGIEPGTVIVVRDSVEVRRK